MKFYAFAATVFVFTRITYSQVSNDECLTATVILPRITLPYINEIPNFVNATANPNDLVSSCSSSISDALPISAWYYWESSVNRLVDFSSIGESQTRDNFDDIYPIITIFQGNECNDMQFIACSGLYLPEFEVKAGTKYFISISAFLIADSSTVTLTVTETPDVPINDECTGALVIPSKITFPFSTVPLPVSTATENANDPVSSCKESSAFTTSIKSDFPTSVPFGPPSLTTATLNFPSSVPFESPISDPPTFRVTTANVWYSWIPLISGLYDLRTDKSTDAIGRIGLSTAIEIYKGNSCNSATEVACSRIEQSIRGVELIAGTKYFIKIITVSSFGASLVLTLNQTPASPPKNEDCVNAMNIHPSKGTIILGDTFSATAGKGLNGFCNSYDSPGLWYKFTVPKPMLIDVSTCNVGTSYDSRIEILSGDKCDDLQCVFANEDGNAQACRLSSSLSFYAKEFTTYYIFVQGFSDDTGYFTLTVDGSPNILYLIDARSDNVIQALTGNDKFSYIDLPSSELNIEAQFEDKVKSVMVTFDNPLFSHCETNAPFAVFRNNNTDYFGKTIPLGWHTVTATPYNGAKCKGPAGTKISKSFYVDRCEYNSIYYDFTGKSKFFLDFYSQIPACKVNIEVAPFCGFDIGFVELKIRNTKTNRIVQTKKELDSPYFVFGNRGQVINRGSLKPGNYTIELNIDGIQHASTPFTAIDNGSCK
jgi:hypothetical protein